MNLIRAGYAVYRGRDWQRTVITYDDIFLADPKMCREAFDPYLEQIFDLKGIDLKESDLDRLSSYFRELQEYVALNEAIKDAIAGRSSSSTTAASMSLSLCEAFFPPSLPGQRRRT